MTTSHELKCFCFNLTNQPRSVQFVLLSITVFLFHLVQGYMHELIFKLDGFKPFSMYLTLIQFAIYSLLAIVESLLKNSFDFKKSFHRK